MSNKFHARFDISWYIMQMDVDKWEIEGSVIDLTGKFSSFDVQVGDVIYNDASGDLDWNTFLPKGYLRYKIIEIDYGKVDGTNIGCLIQWDVDNAAPVEPTAFANGVIGRGSSMGIAYIPSVNGHMADELLLSYARNMELDRVATRLSFMQNQVTSLNTNKENRLGNPTVNGSFLTSNTNGQRIWRTINPVDQSEKGNANGVATLDFQGKIPLQQLPAIAITDVHVVKDETEMLSLSAQQGDIAIRTDISKTYILKTAPAFLKDNWAELAAQGGSGGGTDTAGTSMISNETKRIQTYKIGATYSIGEMVLHSNLLWVARRGLFNVGPFDEKEWILVAGNMSSFNFDSDGDGIIDYANQADKARYAMFSDETRMIQPWRPYRQYVVGEQIIYANEFWIVRNSFTSTDKFDDEFLEPLSLKRHSTLLELQGGNPAFNEFYHLTNLKHQMIDKLVDNAGTLFFNNRVLGDMQRAIYDPNGDGIVTQADYLTGVVVGADKINFLQGAKSNIQEQINVLSYGMTIKGSVQKREHLDLIANRNKGDAIIVLEDEDYGNTKTFYIWDGTAWFYLGPFEIKARDFGIDPINIVTESIGVLPDIRIDTTIARKTDLHTHPNKTIIDGYTLSNAQLLDMFNRRHDHANKGLLDTYSVPNVEIIDTVVKKHEHENVDILNAFSKSGTGKLLFEGKLIEGTGSGGGGIVDLNDFTTNDLKDFTNKRYVTDAEKASLGQLAALITDQASVNMKINEINSKIPASATMSNKLATMADLNSKVGVTQFKQLTDVNQTLMPNAFVIVNPSGTGLTYRNKVDILIEEITDMSGNIFKNIPKLSFKSLKGNLLANNTLELTRPDLFSTDLRDMPKTFEEGKVLVANAIGMKYELRDIGTMTNSKANFAAVIEQGDWTWSAVDNNFQKLVEHKLASKDLIVAFYDNQETNKTFNYKILDENQIMVYSNTDIFAKVVVNCSQGAVGNGTGGSGGSATVTASTFLDDARVRLDKTFSSHQIMEVLKGYPTRSNVYTRPEADARFALLSDAHVHANLDTLREFGDDGFGNATYKGRTLLTSIKSRMHQEQFLNRNEQFALKTIVDVATVFMTQEFSSILSSEFTIKNTIPVVDPITDAKLENQLRLVVNDGPITVMDVWLKPQETQKYMLGISPNIKVLVQGKFDASYVVSAF